MRKLSLFLLLGPLFAAPAHAGSLLSAACQPLGNSQYQITLITSTAVSNDATVSIGSTTDLVGTITQNDDNTTKVVYTGSTDCDGVSLQIVDDNTSYSLTH